MGKGCGKGKKDKGKDKANETHVADTAMVIDISDSDSSRFEDLGDVDATSDTMWTPEYKAPNLLPGKPGEASTSAVTAICVEEEVLDWGDDNDDGMNSMSPSVPKQHFCSMSF